MGMFHLHTTDHTSNDGRTLSEPLPFKIGQRDIGVGGQFG